MGTAFPCREEPFYLTINLIFKNYDFKKDLLPSAPALGALSVHRPLAQHGQGGERGKINRRVETVGRCLQGRGYGDTEIITCFKTDGVIHGDAQIITYTHFFILRMGAGVRDAFPPPMCGGILFVCWENGTHEPTP